MDFEYKAVDSSGKVINRTGHASNRIDLINSLKEQGYTILDIRQLDQAPLPEKSTGKIEISFEIGISHKRLVFFTRQLASTLRAGLPILRCLTLLKSQSISKNLERVIDRIMEDLQNGKSLYEAMRVHNPPFDDFYMSMVKVGESSGSLPEVMSRLADTLEKQYALRQKIKSALSYPIFILVFASTLVYLMMVYLLPGFEPMFKSSGLNLKRDYPLTQMLLDVSDVFQHGWVIFAIIGLVVALYVIYRLIIRFPKSHLVFDKILFNFPFLQGFLQMQYFAQMGESMSTLLSSGVGLLDSIKLSSRSASNVFLQKKLQDACDEIEQGRKMSVALTNQKIFPNLMIQMLAVGEETGNLAEMFKRVADYYDNDLESSLESLTSLMEPAMMVFVGFIVFFFVIGVLLPIMGISQAIQSQM